MKIVLLQKDGLGNQLFQYAAGLFFAKKYEADLEVVRQPVERAVAFGHPRPFALSNFCISALVRERNNWDRLICSVSQKKKPLVIAARLISGAVVWRQPVAEVWTYRPSLPIPRSARTVYVDGFFQTYQIAQDMEERLRSEFQFRYPASGKNIELLLKIRAAENSVSLHIRHGDYQVAHDGKLILSIQYQAQAMHLLRKKVGNPVFFVFSDDIALAREILPKGYNTVFVDHNDESMGHEDLRLMSACRHHVVANSTFSWWGAWLDPNPAKLVCAPGSWQNRADDLPDPDIVPKDWLRIPTEI